MCRSIAQLAKHRYHAYMQLTQRDKKCAEMGCYLRRIHPAEVTGMRC
jgi:hypothetical protein